MHSSGVFVLCPQTHKHASVNTQTQSDELELVADLLFYLLMGCMTAQHENEMQKKGYPKGMQGAVAGPTQGGMH